MIRRYVTVCVLSMILAGCQQLRVETQGETDLGQAMETLASDLGQTAGDRSVHVPPFRSDSDRTGQILARELRKALRANKVRVDPATRADLMVSGSYEVIDRGLRINVRLKDMAGGRVRAQATQYLKRTRSITRELALHQHPETSVVPGFDRRFNDSMCCKGLYDLVPDR